MTNEEKLDLIAEVLDMDASDLSMNMKLEDMDN